MKVKIGKYVNWFGPYQMADLLQKVGVSEDRCHKIGEWLSDTWVGDFLQWVHSKKKRNIKIHLDPWDTWSMDHTLAMIIHPMLVQLKENNHGFFMVDDEDVPEELRSTAAPKVEDWQTDDNAEARYEHVMGEMIWAFEQVVKNDDSQFSKGEIDWYFTEPNENGLCEMKVGPNHTYETDYEAQDAYHKRIANGTRLFGRYYRALWD